MSISYPYLTLSRRLCVRYGDVLKVVDYLDKTFGRSWTEGFVPACKVDTFLPKGDVQQVFIIWTCEQERRRRVLTAETSHPR